MTVRIGFFYVGLAFLLMLFIPNFICARNLPQGYTAAGENRLLLACERAGQGAVTALALMVLYELWWLRNFRGARTRRDFYSSFLGVPLAGATLPVAAFFLLGIYGRVVWLCVSAVLLGIGHIGIHRQHSKQMQSAQGRGEETV